MHEAGFDDREAAQGANALTALIFGTVQLQPARKSDSEADCAEREWFQHNVLVSQLPHLHRALYTAPPPNPSADFEYQLDLLVAGLETRSAR